MEEIEETYQVQTIKSPRPPFSGLIQVFLHPMEAKLIV
jgi:hypothetical protein